MEKSVQSYSTGTVIVADNALPLKMVMSVIGNVTEQLGAELKIIFHYNLPTLTMV